MKEIDLIALAGLLHDIGKFGQRAEIDIQKDSYDFQSYCPMKFGSYWTHQHSAFTAEFLKSIVGKQDEFSFIDTMIDGESFENISAKHHRPTTAKEWIVAISDRVASGFERDEYNEYNTQDDRGEKLKYYEVPLDGVFDKNKKFPLGIFNISNIVARDVNKYSKDEYNKLYNEFLDDLKVLKEKPKQNFIYALEYLLKKYTSFIPSSTYKTKANIPLYDHLKTTATFASALYAYHKNNLETESIKDYETKKFLLIAGDFFGIQDFIFSNVPTSKASKILRGKSAFIQIFMQIVALKLCEDLEISHLSIISTTAGKFEILAPNTKEVKEKITSFQEKLNKYFIDEFLAQGGIGISYVKASCDDFTSKRFLELREELKQKIELTKYKKFDLAKTNPIISFDEDKTKDNEHLCKTCNQRFLKDSKDESCEFCKKFIDIGKNLAKKNFLQIRKNDGDIEIYENIYIKFSSSIDEDTIVVYDISNDEKFKGYSKWALNSYVKFSENEDRIEEFEELAMESCDGGDIGVKALMSLKGDVDNMGNFLKNSDINSFAKFNFISRLIDYFFSVKVSNIMSGKNLYTIFAGGDDLFIIGAWDEVIDISKEIRQEFMKFVDGSDLSFSVGMIMFKPSTPINYIANISEEALESSKDYKKEQSFDEKEKNAITLFGQTVGWDEYIYDMLEDFEVIKDMAIKHLDIFNTAFWYRLLDFCDMSENIKVDFKNAMWKARLSYMYKRNVLDKIKDENMEDLEEVLKQIYENIETYGAGFKMIISEFIYKRRD